MEKHSFKTKLRRILSLILVIMMVVPFSVFELGTEVGAQSYTSGDTYSGSGSGSTWASNWTAYGSAGSLTSTGSTGGVYLKATGGGQSVGATSKVTVAPKGTEVNFTLLETTGNDEICFALSSNQINAQPNTWNGTMYSANFNQNSAGDFYKNNYANYLWSSLGYSPSITYGNNGVDVTIRRSANGTPDSVVIIVHAGYDLYLYYYSTPAVTLNYGSGTSNTIGIDSSNRVVINGVALNGETNCGQYINAVANKSLTKNTWCLAYKYNNTWYGNYNNTHLFYTGGNKQTGNCVNNNWWGIDHNGWTSLNFNTANKDTADGAKYIQEPADSNCYPTINRGTPSDSIALVTGNNMYLSFGCAGCNANSSLMGNNSICINTVSNIPAINLSKDFTLTIDRNGGTGGGTNTTSYKFGDTLTLTVPTKSGYDFAGWILKSGNSGASETMLNTSGTYTGTYNYYGDVTVEAQWEEIQCEHHWSNWTDNGDGTHSHTCSSTCGKTVTENHTPWEWNTTTAPTCTTAGSQTRTCTVCNATETQTISATGHNHQIEKYTLHDNYSESGVTQGNYGEYVPLYEWHTCQNCGDHYSIETQGSKATYTLTIKCDTANGGSFHDGTTADKTYQICYYDLYQSRIGSFSYYMNNINNLNRTGYRVHYWDIETALETGVFSDNEDGYNEARFLANSDLTLIPIWTPIQYTLTLNDNGGSGGSSSATVAYDATSIGTFTAPTQSGYSFDGYYTADSGGTKVVNSDGSLVSGTVSGYVSGGKWNRTSNATLYAHWVIATFTDYYFNPTNTAVLESHTYTVGDSSTGYTVPSVAYNSSTGQYNINLTWGGYPAGSPTKQWTYSGGSVFNANPNPAATSNRNFYISTYTPAFRIEYNANGGYWDGVSDTANKTPTYAYTANGLTTDHAGYLVVGERYVWPDATDTLTREGYRLHTSIDALNIVRYYTANGAGSGITYSGNRYYGYDIWPYNTSTLASQSGLNGYSRSNDGANINFGAYNSSTAPNGTVTLYAVWDPIVTYYLNDGTGRSVQDFNYVTGAEYAGLSDSQYTILGVGGMTMYNTKDSRYDGRTTNSTEGVRTNRDGITSSDLIKIPERSGYQLLGWATSQENANNGTIAYNVGDIPSVTAPLDLYAVWSAGTTVTLHAGYNGAGSNYTVTVNNGSTVTLYNTKAEVASNYSITPNSYNSNASFVGWNTNEQGTGTWYTTLDNTNSDLAVTDLYAMWLYPVVWDANGGTFASGFDANTPSTITTYTRVSTGSSALVLGGKTWNHGQSFVDAGYTSFPGQSDLTRANYTLFYSGTPFFLIFGYNTNTNTHNNRVGRIFTTESKDECFTAEGFTNAYTYNIYPKTNGVITMYAIWLPDITFDNNGGSGSMSKVNTDIEWDQSNWPTCSDIADGATNKAFTTTNGHTYYNPYYKAYTAPSCTFTAPTGKRFAGWKVKYTGTSNYYNNGHVYAANEQIFSAGYASDTGFAPVTLEAQWVDQTYTVTFSTSPAAAGTFTNTTSNAIAVPAGTTYTVSGNIITFTKPDTTKIQVAATAGTPATGYTRAFTSWSSQSGTINANASITATFTDTLIQYSVYYYKVVNGGEPSLISPAGMPITYNITSSNETLSYSEEGYNVEWRSGSASGTVVTTTDFNGQTGDKYYYALLTLKTYTVTYLPGTNGTGDSDSDTKTHGVDLTLNGATFTRSGYNQTGWSTTDGGAKAYELGDTYSANADITLYPYWESAGCTIRYHYNDGTDNYTDVVVSNPGATIEITNAVTYTGYTLQGWTTSALTPDVPALDGYRMLKGTQAHEIKFAQGATPTTESVIAFKDENGIVDLYAQWRGNFYIVSNAKDYTVTSAGKTVSYEDDGSYYAGIGTQMTISYTQGDKFCCWVNSSGKLLGTNTTLTYAQYSENNAVVAVSDSTDIGYFVSFQSYDGQVLSAKLYTDQTFTSAEFPEIVPTKLGYIHNGWIVTKGSTSTTYETVAEATSAVQGLLKTEGAISVVPSYRLNENEYIVTTIWEDTSGTELRGTSRNVGRLGQLFESEVEATYKGLYFQYWTDGTDRISYNTMVRLRRVTSQTVNLTAVYGATALAESAKSVYVRTPMNTLDTTGTKNKVSFITELAVPETWTVVEMGILYTGQSKYAGGDGFELGASKVNKYIDQDPEKVCSITLNINVPKSTAGTFYARGYVIYIDADGVQHTAYSTGVASQTVGS